MSFMFGVDSGPEIHTFSNSKTVEINHNRRIEKLTTNKYHF